MPSGRWTAWADGAASHQLGIGGIGVVFQNGGKVIPPVSERAIGGRITSVRMEISSVLAAVRNIPMGTKAKVLNDCKTVERGVKRCRNGKASVPHSAISANQDLWNELAALLRAKPGVRIYYLPSQDRGEQHREAHRLAHRQLACR